MSRGAGGEGGGGIEGGSGSGSGLGGGGGSTKGPPEMHRLGKDWHDQPCLDAAGAPRLTPPCAAYVEIMVPVFSRQAW